MSRYVYMPKDYIWSHRRGTDEIKSPTDDNSEGEMSENQHAYIRQVQFTEPAPPEDELGVCPNCGEHWCYDETIEHPYGFVIHKYRCHCEGTTRWVPSGIEVNYEQTEQG